MNIFQGNFNLFLDIISVAQYFENSQLALDLAGRGLGALDAKTLGQKISEMSSIPPKKQRFFSVFFSYWSKNKSIKYIKTQCTAVLPMLNSPPLVQL